MNSLKEQKGLIEAKLSTLKHIKAIINSNIDARKKELKELVGGVKK